MPEMYEDRRDAGRKLASMIAQRGGWEDAIVLGLPRGGAPVAHEVAQALGAPLDLVIVRKIGAPGQEELAMGAIASGGGRVLNHEVVDSLGVPEEAIEEIVEREQDELRRREAEYRGDRAAPSVEGRTVVLVDDGMATGATMRAAAEALRSLKPKRIVIAAGVAPRETVLRLEAVADEVIVPMTPSQFMSVGSWFKDFDPTTDAEVRSILESAWSEDSPDGGEGRSS